MKLHPKRYLSNFDTLIVSTYCSNKRTIHVLLSRLDQSLIRLRSKSDYSYFCHLVSVCFEIYNMSPALRLVNFKTRLIGNLRKNIRVFFLSFPL